MGITGWLNHMLNFAWPALVLAVWMPLSVRWTSMGRRATTGLLLQMGVLAVVNVGVLAAGLSWFGLDGKMATYLAMAVCSASTIWLLVRAWRT